MSKAEERAFEVYPKETRDITGFVTDIGHPQYIRDYYIEGYHQAEKDNELTWDDVSVLNCLLNEVEHDFKKGLYEDKDYIGYCKEVLKRFKDFKEREKI